MERQRATDEPVVARYWCHMCSRMVNPNVGEEIKCPICDGGFMEEMNGEGGEIETAADLASDRYLSLWAPILLGMLRGGSLRRRRLLREGEEEDSDQDLGLEAIPRRRRRSSAILQLLQSLGEGSRIESSGVDSERDRQRDREHTLLINHFNNAIVLRGSLDTDHSQGQSSSGSSTGIPLGDYFLGPGLDLLLHHLEENDPSRHGTPPAQKEAVEAMPSVKIEENTSCSVCLEDFEVGAEAREMPCKHKFHSECILPWLELHSSCPVCRFQMPTDGSKISSAGGNGDRVEVHGGNGDGGSERGSWLPVPRPFNGLLSLLGSHRTGNSSSAQPSSSSIGSHTRPNEN